MNRFWGQNPGGCPHKLSRNEGQLLALNYENLCDSDYLNRLFTVLSGEQHDLQGQQAPLKDNESWVLTADTAEDVIVFGEDFSLGRNLLKKRFLTGISTSVSSHDILSTLVQRQVIVFENIGKLVETDCIQQEKKSKTSENEDGLKVDKNLDSPCSRQQNKKHIASEALCCALRTLAKHSRNQLQRSAVDPILSLILSMYQEQRSTGNTNSLDGSGTGSRIDEMHLKYLREILCNGVEHGIELFAACTQTIGVKQNEEHLKLCMSCAYGLLTVGVYGKSADDILMAFLHLLAISMLINESQSFLLNDRELETSMVSTSDKLPESSDSGRANTDPIMNEHEDLQKTNLKLKMKMKNKENSMNPFPIISKISAAISPSLAVATSDSKLTVLQNDLQPLYQQKIKNHKSAKWEVNNLKPNITLIDKMKDPRIQNSSKYRIQLVKSRLFSEEDFTPDKLNSPNKKLPLRKIISAQISGSGNNHEDRSSPSFDGNWQSHCATPTSSDTPSRVLSGSRQSSRQDDDNQLVSATVGCESFGSGDSHNIDSYNALRASLKSHSRISTSVLQVLMDGCTELREVHKSRLALPALEAVQHRSAIASKSYVWSCGQNSYGELGHCDGAVRKSFTKISFLEGKGVVSVGAGNEHSIFVCEDGKVFVTGYNDNGQCGNGKTEQVKSPQLVSALAGEDITKVFVFNGCEHTLLTTRDGKLYSFGYNYRGQVRGVTRMSVSQFHLQLLQYSVSLTLCFPFPSFCFVITFQLGHGSTTIESVPRLVKSLILKKVISAACSYHHSVLLCSDGSLYSCGRNDCGQLGHGDTVDKKTPHQVTSLGATTDGKISEISCGQFHTVMLTSGGVAYSCGKNDYGQTCLEGSESTKLFTKTLGQSPHDLLKQVCCGYYHTLLLSHSGVVTGFGRNDYGQLGKCPTLL